MKPFPAQARPDFIIFLLILITMPEYHCNYSSNSFWHVLVLWGQNMFSCDEAILLWARSYIIAGSKLYSQCCNAIETDRSLRSEWLKSTQRTIICKAVKTSVENLAKFLYKSCTHSPCYISNGSNGLKVGKDEKSQHNFFFITVALKNDGK